MPSDDAPGAGVADDAAGHRYLLETGGTPAFADYRLDRGIIVFTHTVVPREYGGRGLGNRLIAGALADVRRRGLKVEPHCEFVRAYIERHPEWQDLLAD
jgi:predicted GNAT family acetyltransferase